MAQMRIRSIKPEFWADEVVGSWPYETRLVYIALWNEADDEGRLRCNSNYLRCKLFPYDLNLDMDQSLQRLVADGKLVIYQDHNQSYGFLPKFTEHQVVNRPTASKLPGPINEHSDMPHGALTEHSRSIQCGKGREGKGMEGKGVERARARGDPTSQTIDPNPEKNGPAKITTHTTPQIGKEEKKEAKPEPARNAPTLGEAVEYFRKSKYSNEEVKRTWQSFSSTAVEGIWFWGKRPITDWRHAMECRLGEYRDTHPNANTSRGMDQLMANVEREVEQSRREMLKELKS